MTESLLLKSALPSPVRAASDNHLPLEDVMTEFTPGPWDLAWEDGKHGVVAASVDGKMVFIGMIGNDDGDVIKNEVRKANACLVAVAPDLLAALVRCEATITELVRDHPEWVAACDRTALREARDAIARVRDE